MDYKIPLDKMQELRLTNLEKHAARSDLSPDALFALAIVGMSGAFDSRTQGDLETVEKFEIYHSEFYRRWRQSVGEAAAATILTAPPNQNEVE